MASLTKAINKDLFDSILPTFGNQRVHIPVWDEGQKMFLCEEYESASGNRYYKGVRFCDRIVVVEQVGLYHNWTYIDGIEVYAFNGTRLELVQKRDYDKVHRNEEFIRKELETMVRNFFEGVLKAERSCMAEEELEEKAWLLQAPGADPFKHPENRLWEMCLCGTSDDGTLVFPSSQEEQNGLLN